MTKKKEHIYLFEYNFLTIQIFCLVLTVLFVLVQLDYIMTLISCQGISQKIIAIQQNNAPVDKYGKITAEVIKQC